MIIDIIINNNIFYRRLFKKKKWKHKFALGYFDILNSQSFFIYIHNNDKIAFKYFTNFCYRRIILIRFENLKLFPLSEVNLERRRSAAEDDWSSWGWVGQAIADTFASFLFRWVRDSQNIVYLSLLIFFVQLSLHSLGFEEKWVEKKRRNSNMVTGPKK